MLKIGIIGNCHEAKKTLKHILKDTFKNFYILKINENIFKKGFNKNLKVKILIINEISKLMLYKNINPPKDCIVLLNIDCVEKLPFKIKTSYLITYGLNQKATVTLSSIEKVQFCLQRNLKSLNGNLVLQQEFPIKYQLEDLGILLACTTVGLLNDIN